MSKILGKFVEVNTTTGMQLFDDDLSNFVAIKSAAIVASNFTLRLPAADGTSGQVLQTDGAGLLSFVTPGGSGANTTLSNLGSTSINADLNPSADNVRALGASASNRYNIGYFNNLSAVTYDTQNGHISLVDGNSTMPSGSTAQGKLFKNGSNNIMGIYTENSGGTNSSKLFLETGNVTSGAFTSGDIKLRIGTSTGTRGKLSIIDGSEGTTGHVWTSTGTGGQGAWAAAAGAGANTTLSNLGSTAVNAHIIPGITHSKTLGSVSLVWNVVYTDGIDGATDQRLYVESNFNELEFYSAIDQFTFMGSYGGNGAKIKLQNAADSAHVGLQCPPALGASYTLTLPNDDGTSGQVLSTNGSGLLSWATAGSPTIYTSLLTLNGPIDYGASGANYDVNFTSNSVSGSDLTYTAGGAGDSDIVTVNTTGYYKIEFKAIIADASFASPEYVMGVTINRAASTTAGVETATAAQIAYVISATIGSAQSYWLGSKIIQLTATDVLRFPPDSSTSVFANIDDLVMTIRRVHPEQGD